MEWTDERVATLKRLWEDGRSASQIAEAMGDVSRNAVIGKAHRLGLKGRPSPIRRERVARSKQRTPTVKRTTRVGERQCHWPIGHPREPGFHFCGAPAEPEKPYCAEHCAVAYRRSDHSAA